MLRVAMVCSSYRPNIGGVETHVGEIVDALARRGVRVDVLTQDAEGGLPAVDESSPEVVVRRFRAFGPGARDAQAPGLWSWIARRSTDYDLIHTHSYHAFVSLGAAAAARQPVVFTPHYHGTGHSTARVVLHRAYRPLGRRIFAKAASVVCVSDAEAELVASDFPRTAGKVRVIPNGVDVEALRAAQPFEDPDPYFVSLGRLERYKRVDRLIEAMASVPAPARLVVIGSGPARPDLVRLASASSARARITFLAHLPRGDVQRWLAGARAVVSMSEHEAFGLTLAEGLAAGCGIVASDIAAHREVVRLGPADAVRLVPANATGIELASALTSFLPRERDIDRGRNVASWDDVGTETLSLYRDLVAGG